MPSPFPGMGPYLEGDDWTSFHTHFATEIARQLTPRLRPKYVAMPEKRFDVVDERAPHTWVGSYFVFVSRADQRPMLQVWPIALDHPLPSIPEPLLPGDADINLDLQSAFQNVYDLCGFDLVLDYSKVPHLALNDDQAAWVAERLRAVKG
jgi:hypothetical protein